MNEQQQYRQGDILFEAIGDIPATAKPIKRRGGRIIVAEGEVTGHHHAIADPGVEMLTATEVEQFLRVTNEAKVRHPEHQTIVLPPGNYRVRRQREYTPQEVRRVAD